MKSTATKAQGATRQAPKKALLNRPNIVRFLKPLSIGVTVSSVLIAAFLLLLNSVNKQVIHLQVNADLKHISTQMIEQTIEPFFPSGYVTLDVNSIKTDLTKMIMVSQASVEKVWPDTLVIHIEEERPVAIWNDKNMLSENGDILPVALKQLALPKLSGVQQESKLVMQHFLLFSRWVKRHQMELIELKHSSAGWLLKNKNGLKIWLDNATAMSGLKQLDRVIEQFDLARIQRIDMRYEQGFAVAWKNSMTQAQG